ESTALRFAKVDMQQYPKSRDYVMGDAESGEVYYTNSIHLSPDADVDIIERIEKQGKFNTLIESGAITHVFIGEQRPDPQAIFKLVKRTWDTTQSAQICISPEFTICNDCGKVTPGYKR
ncbi:MAG: anaerobic ribonucleoside-triphosphate reductase, partial [Nanoarchaeota archaeon]|nr:anaerobic ribonucleoside-triphosphate reductase [Nanoarchaeota archaeon]